MGPGPLTSEFFTKFIFIYAPNDLTQSPGQLYSVCPSIILRPGRPWFPLHQPLSLFRGRRRFLKSLQKALYVLLEVYTKNVYLYNGRSGTIRIDLGWIGSKGLEKFSYIGSPGLRSGAVRAQLGEWPPEAKPLRGSEELVLLNYSKITKEMLIGLFTRYASQKGYMFYTYFKKSQNVGLPRQSTKWIL